MPGRIPIFSALWTDIRRLSHLIGVLGDKINSLLARMAAVEQQIKTLGAGTQPPPVAGNGLILAKTGGSGIPAATADATLGSATVALYYHSGTTRAATGVSETCVNDAPNAAGINTFIWCTRENGKLYLVSEFCP